jgi:hypothetical protein
VRAAGIVAAMAYHSRGERTSRLVNRGVGESPWKIAGRRDSLR